MKLTTKIEIPAAQAIAPIEESGIVSFSAYIGGFLCTVFTIVRVGMEKKAWERMKEGMEEQSE